jgi:hypothetical protein
MNTDSETEIIFTRRVNAWTPQVLGIRVHPWLSVVNCGFEAEVNRMWRAAKKHKTRTDEIEPRTTPSTRRNPRMTEGRMMNEEVERNA